MQWVENVLFTHVFGMFRIARCRKKITINVPLPTTPTTNIMLKINGTIYVSGRSLYGLYSSQSGSSSVQPLACWPVASDGSNVTLLAINDGMPIFRDFLWFFHNPVYYRFSCCFCDSFERKPLAPVFCFNALSLISMIRNCSKFNFPPNFHAVYIKREYLIFLISEFETLLNLYRLFDIWFVIMYDAVIMLPLFSIQIQCFLFAGIVKKVQYIVAAYFHTIFAYFNSHIQLLLISLYNQ